MIYIDNLKQILAQIETERGISQDTLVSAIQQALASACKRVVKKDILVDVEIDLQTGEAILYQKKRVVAEIEDEDHEMLLSEAKKMDAKAKIDTEISWVIRPDNFGRLAAQTAKQVIIQRIREAEKNIIYDEYIEKVGTIITGSIQRIEARHYLVNLGKSEAILPFKETIPGEKFLPKENVRILIADIEKTSKGNFIRISRTHPGFLKALFELEIPEIQDGIIEIKSVSREPGHRAKIAVKTNNPSIGAVGTCVGHMGGRIQSIIKELGNEKIDVLEWDEDPRQFIANALKPAKINEVIVTSEEENTAVVVVANDQLSLAIGKQGVNVRLSVKLTNWKLDIMSEDEYEEKKDSIISVNKLSIADKMKSTKDAKETAETSDLASRIKQSNTDESEDDADQANPFLSKLTKSTPKIELIKASDFAKLMDIKTKDLVEIAKDNDIDITTRSKLDSKQVEQLKEIITK